MKGRKRVIRLLLFLFGKGENNIWFAQGQSTYFKTQKTPQQSTVRQLICLYFRLYSISVMSKCVSLNRALVLYSFSKTSYPSFLTRSVHMRNAARIMGHPVHNISVRPSSVAYPSHLSSQQQQPQALFFSGQRNLFSM